MSPRAQRSPEREYDPLIDGPEDGDQDQDRAPDDPVGESGVETPPARTPEPEPPEPEDPQVEARARRMGWVPQAEFRGSPKTWRPAQEFLDRAYANSRIFNERLDKVTDELEETKKTNQAILHRLDESTQVLGEVTKRWQNAEENAYKRARADIEKEMKDAVAEGNTEGYEAAKARLDELEEPPPAPVVRQPTAPAKPGVDPVVKAWADENPWLEENALAGDYAEKVHARIKVEKPHLTMKQNLYEVRQEVSRRFPEIDENPRRRAPSSARTPSGDRGGGNGKGRGYNDLPADAQAACDKFCRTIPGFTVRDYLRTYDWDSPS